MSIFEDITAIQNIIYIVASILFISGIKSHKVLAPLTATQAYFKESFSSEFDGWGEVNAGNTKYHLYRCFYSFYIRY